MRNFDTAGDGGASDFELIFGHHDLWNHKTES